MRRLVLESVSYLAQADDGELAAYLVRLCELPDGGWNVHLMGTGLGYLEAGNSFATPKQGCEAAATWRFTSRMDAAAVMVNVSAGSLTAAVIPLDRNLPSSL